MAWSEAARIAAREARKAHAKARSKLLPLAASMEGRSSLYKLSEKSYARNQLASLMRSVRSGSFRGGTRARIIKSAAAAQILRAVTGSKG